MNKIIQKPHLFFFGLIPVALILGLIFKSQTLDFAYYGGNISFNYLSIFAMSSVYFGLIGLNYFSLKLINKPPKKWLSIMHIVIQVVALAILIYYILTINTLETNQEKQIINLVFFIGFILFLVSILVHLINFFTSLFLKTE